MNWLRNRPFSQNLTVFDFAPKSEGTLEKIGRPANELGQWKKFSAKIDSSLDSFAAKNLRGEETIDRFFDRLEDPNGGVILLYAHSDGKSISLDTKDGMQKISREELQKRYGPNRKNLCPVILANCETRSSIAKDFLDAGCPFVATSDSPLPIDEIAIFVDSMTKFVHRDGMDVIDAYYKAQSENGPYRMRPIAEGGAPHVAPRVLLYYTQSSSGILTTRAGFETKTDTNQVKTCAEL